LRDPIKEPDTALFHLRNSPVKDMIPFSHGQEKDRGTALIYNPVFFWKMMANGRIELTE
jgi:hypothetical protein